MLENHQWRQSLDCLVLMIVTVYIWFDVNLHAMHVLTSKYEYPLGPIVEKSAWHGISLWLLDVASTCYWHALLIHIQICQCPTGIYWDQSYCCKSLFKILFLWILVKTAILHISGLLSDQEEHLKPEMALDEGLVESAKSSLLFELIEKEENINGLITLSVLSMFQNQDVFYNR